MRKDRQIPGFKNSRAVTAENGLCLKSIMTRVKLGLFPAPIVDGRQYFWSVSALEDFYKRRLERAARGQGC